jgi:sodium/bile acid cotransporter 7
MAGAIAASAVNPALGLRGGPLKPELTVETLSVSLIFLLSGLSLPSSDLRGAATNVKLNALVQSYSFLLTPLAAQGLSKAVLRPLRILDATLVDGIVAVSCLPTTVNMCIVLTTAADGNVAAAAFSAVLGNFLGVFLSPMLLTSTLSVSTGGSEPYSYLSVLRKLTKKVVVPMAVGQGLRRKRSVVAFQQAHKKALGKASEVLLLTIIYTTFCDAFQQGLFSTTSAAGSMGSLLVAMPLLHLALFGGAFALARAARLSPRDTIATAFAASHKTLAMGIPLLSTVFAGQPTLALLCAPLLVLHPIQLAIGGLVVPVLRRYGRSEL